MAERELSYLLKQRSLESKNPIDFFSSIRNVSENKKAVIMATGPTISEYSDEQYADFLQDKNLFSVKQVFHKLPQYTDVHFFNCSNIPIEKDYMGYKYNEHKPFVFASSSYHSGVGHDRIRCLPNGLAVRHSDKPRWSSSQLMHVFMKVPIPTEPTSEPSVLWNSHKFEDYLFENQLQRCCGPGIFIETVLYFVLHLGFKEIYTIGWDYASNNSKYGHFFNDGKKADETQVNAPGDIMPNEISRLVDFTEPLADWLISKGVTLKVVGNLSRVSNKFERIEI